MSGSPGSALSAWRLILSSFVSRGLYNKKENTNLQERLVEYETNECVACNVCGQVGEGSVGVLCAPAGANLSLSVSDGDP